MSRASRIVMIVALALVACRGARSKDVAGQEAAAGRGSVLIFAEAAGLSAEQVEAQVLLPLESAVAPVQGLRSMHASAMPGLAVLRCIFDGEPRALAARLELTRRLRDVSLPPGVFAGLGARGARQSRVAYALRSDARSLLELRELQDWVLRPRLLAQPGVIEVRGCGGAVTELAVRVDPARLAARGLTIADVSGALSARSATAPSGGNARDGIGDTSIGLATGVPVRVRDVAEIALAPAPGGCEVRLPAPKGMVVGLVEVSAAEAARVTALLDDLVRELPRDVQLIRLWDAPPLRLRVATPARLGHEARTRLQALLATEVGRRLDSHAVLVLSGDPVDDALPGELDVLVAASKGTEPLEVVSAAAAAIPGLAPPRDHSARMIFVAGDDLAVLTRVAAELLAKVAAQPGVTASGVLGTGDEEHLTITPDASRMARYRVEPAAVRDTIAAAQDGLVVAQVIDGARRRGVRVVLGGSSQDAARSLQVHGPDGSLVPLAELATIETSATPAVILRHDGVRVVAVWLRGPSRSVLAAIIARALAAPVPAEVHVTADEAPEPTR